MAKKYYYHGTTATGVLEIAKQGLIEGGGADSLWSEARNRPWAIYVTGAKLDAQIWADLRVTMLFREWGIEDTPDIIRFRATGAASECTVEPDVVEGLRMPNSFVLQGCRIPPEEIEIWDGRRWTPIQEEVSIQPLRRRPEVREVRKQFLRREVRVRQHRRRA